MEDRIQCAGRTTKGTQCSRFVSVSEGCCYQHMEQPQCQRDVQPDYIKYPWASSFVEWILPKLKSVHIYAKSKDTDGDYYKIQIGRDGHEIMIDWKHLDDSEIDQFNDAIADYGFVIEYKRADREGDYGGFDVKFKRV